jgi:threonine aldolase
MRSAMAAAEIGDDVYKEDPTVKALEELAAAKVGMEAGLFVASGTMGNLTGILSHASRGDQALVGDEAHTFRSEAGGMAVLGGIVPKPISTDTKGMMTLSDIESAISPDDPHYPPTRVILLENTFARKNGYPLKPEYFSKVEQLASRHRLSIHLDGARLFNAVTALEIEADAITCHVDSVSICLSKGLCAPVGSVLCGSDDFINLARRNRKLLGGAMRQAGVIAAAGIISLNEMIDRLAEDHSNARFLAEQLADIDEIRIDPEDIKTNIVFFNLRNGSQESGQKIIRRLRDEYNILLELSGPRKFRAVTHYWVCRENVEELVQGLKHILVTEPSFR